MKRYLTVGIVFGVLVVIVVTISWFAFPAWKDPTSGGFWTLLGLVFVGVFTFVKDMVSVWKDLREEKKEEPKPVSAPLQSVRSQQAKSIYNAPGGAINIYPLPATKSEEISADSTFPHTSSAKPAHSTKLKRFSTNINKLTKGKRFSGPGQIFLRFIKDAPPFLGIEHSKPVITLASEQIIIEHFEAKGFIQSNLQNIQGGGSYSWKIDDTWEKVAKKVYGDGKFGKAIESHNFEGYYIPHLPAGSSINLPYIDISNTLYMPPSEIEKKFSRSHENHIQPVLDLIRNQHSLQEDETLPLVKIVYEAAMLIRRSESKS